jgi:hypothetical protein
MLKFFPVIIIALYFLALLQTSFFFSFGVFGILCNFVLFGVILLNLFEKTEGKAGIFGAIIGGFFLDMFSENFMGFYVIVALAVSLFLKYVLRKYVKLPAVG